MLVIGLTGGIATGKSSVSSLLKSYDIPIVDADILAREAVAPGTKALARIVQTFGRGVIRDDGTLDRPALGRIIFNDGDARKKLNAIVHPAVRHAMFWAVMQHWWAGERICVVDVPLLIESKLYPYVGRVMVVYCSMEIQLRRLMERDKSSREEAQSRVNSQLPIADKLPYADIVIDNSGSTQELQSQIANLVQRLHREAGWEWQLSRWFPPFAAASALGTMLFRAIKRRQRTLYRGTRSSSTRT